MRIERIEKLLGGTEEVGVEKATADSSLRRRRAELHGPKSKSGDFARNDNVWDGRCVD